VKLAYPMCRVKVGAERRLRSIVPALKYFAIVLRDSPVRRLIG